MATLPATSLLLQGLLTTEPPPPPSPGYIRLSSKGPIIHFVELTSKSLVGPALGPFQLNSPAQYLVDINSELHFSDYPLPAGQLGGLGQVQRGQGAASTAQGYFGEDGTPLTATPPSGQVAVLHGTRKNGDRYRLSLQTGALRGTGYTNDYMSANASIAISVNEDSPLVFGFWYCPLMRLVDVFLYRANVDTGILVDLRPLTLQQNGTFTGSATLTRNVFYYGDNYSTQILGMLPTQTDPAMYIPAVATLWPYLERIGFFGPALNVLANQAANQLPPLNHTPLYTLGTVDYQGALSLQAFVSNTISLAGPALGPLAAAFSSPSGSPAPAYEDASKWLGWVLTQGSGRQNLADAITGFYNYFKSHVWTGWQDATSLPQYIPVSGAWDGPKPPKSRYP